METVLVARVRWASRGKDAGSADSGSYRRDRGRSSRRSRPTSGARSRGVQRGPAAQPLFRQALLPPDHACHERQQHLPVARSLQVGADELVEFHGDEQNDGRDVEERREEDEHLEASDRGAEVRD